MSGVKNVNQTGQAISRNESSRSEEYTISKPEITRRVYTLSQSPKVRGAFIHYLKARNYEAPLLNALRNFGVEIEYIYIYIYMYMYK